jgi:hypothetical protein
VQGKLDVPLLCLFRATGPTRIRKSLSDQKEPSSVRGLRLRAALPCVGNALSLQKRSGSDGSWLFFQSDATQLKVEVALKFNVSLSLCQFGVQEDSASTSRNCASDKTAIGKRSAMAMNNSAEGSLWRRWDLHLHTPITRLANDYEAAGTDEAWNRYIDALEASAVQAFGITEYFGFDGFFQLQERYAAKYPKSGKVIFANMELRLSESISRNGTQPHLHIIFDNDPAISSRDVLTRFCTNLNTQAADGTEVRVRCADLDTPAKIQAATVSLDHVEDALKATFGIAKPYLLVFPANNDGLRSTDNNSPRKVQLADRIDRACHAFFGNAANRDFFLRIDRYTAGAGPSEPKSVISGSDAHSFVDLERLSGDVAGFPATWIKADLTFRGLQQICFEPEDRAFSHY